MSNNQSILFTVTDPTGKEIIHSEKLSNVTLESSKLVVLSDGNVEYISEIIYDEIKGYRYKENKDEKTTSSK